MSIVHITDDRDMFCSDVDAPELSNCSFSCQTITDLLYEAVIFEVFHVII